MNLEIFAKGIPLTPLPPAQGPDPNFPHAPKLNPNLSALEEEIAVANALRYFPEQLHEVLAEDFARELKQYGHIYMYRFKPPRELIQSHPVDRFPGKCIEAKAIQMMILNNLDMRIAQFPEELVTYGGNGQVFSNWAQFWLVMQALSRLDRQSTLVLYSGHPLGIFSTHSGAPRMTITNGMLVPRSGLDQSYEKLFALGVTQYGQMTAGSFCYIGPQGIVHGTTLTLLNAFRRHGSLNDDRARPGVGKVFLSAGLGGMSGAQAKAAVISGCVGVIAEMSEEALDKRLKQGWVTEKVIDLHLLVEKMKQYKAEKKAISIGFLGNIVDVWEELVKVHKMTGERLVDVASDQTSCHNPFHGGYYPVGLSYEEARSMMAEAQEDFQHKVHESLCRQVEAINHMADAGTYFFDYGNAFLLQASRAGAQILATEAQLKEAAEIRREREFRYPSYVEDIIGDIFSLGFGPYRWICASCEDEDLRMTDKMAEEVLKRLLKDTEAPQEVREQYMDNLRWIEEAWSHKMVVGSKARILYADERARVQIAVAFNEAVKSGRLMGPVILSRDHHDVSGTDSPYRETSNVYDGSRVCADMAVQNVINGAACGATWVSLHNGGGVGWGEVMNGGFGHVLDGSEEAVNKAKRLLSWDVTNGIGRRAWSGNNNARLAVLNKPHDSSTDILLPNPVLDNKLIKQALKKINNH
ncbi:Urocanate hydratase [Cichlidogyrus casuarinus]|uniref:urocanate hydratase n=1 Tax=Cichlidogyrus casuarinus TaxID=1844966 RepID=A0ABD2Q1C7_9PLAT